MLRYNDVLLHTVIFLISVGLVMVYSASTNPLASEVSGLSILVKQIIWIAIGSFMFLVASQINYKKLIKLSKGFLLLSIFFVILGYITSYGSTTARWVSLFGANLFQTSELAKIAIIIFTASFIDNNKRKISDYNFMIKNFYPYIVILLGLILLQPDLSSSFMIAAIVFTMLFVAGLDFKQIKFLIISGFILFVSKFGVLPLIYSNNSYDFQQNRFFGFISGSSTQQQNSIDSIASGGPLGLGLGQSMWKGDYVALPQTDFIFSVITSELGMFGFLILFVSFIVFFLRGISIVKESKDVFGMFLALGITLNITFYFVVHVGYNIGLLPTTGLPLPFVSYGGSHTLFNLIQVGLLLSISSKIKNER
ncbi:MAG: hypothetical protein CMG00_06760 [Candidatus Marinimicrobia bacterium]|nr:hypothetical protein [Candidatus Neomarinimicrobiota bacterium]|tara:strand:+ start:3245 stop:4339 length:1095 start_codon:yes stop_codon:yes gene_type:complete